MKTWNNNVNLSYCKYSFLCKQWYLAGLTWRKPFSNQKTRLYTHEWSLVTFKICGVLCSRNEKTLPLRKVAGSTSRSEQREGQRENKILFNNLSFQYFCVASCNNNAIFVGFSLICLESLGFLKEDFWQWKEKWVM